MRTPRVPILMAAVIACGCTELEVKRATPGLVEGLAYTLPKKTFMITVSYELRNCVDGSPVTLDVAKIPSVTAASDPDETERFYIPYSSLRNWFKDTDLTIEQYETTQTLKSVVSTIKDKTGDTITAAIGTALRVSAIASGTTPPAGPAAPPAAKAAPVCNQEAIKTLKAIAELRAKATLTADETARLASLKASLTHKEAVAWAPRKLGGTQSDPVYQIVIQPDGLVGPHGKWVVAGKDASHHSGLTTAIQLSVAGTVSEDPKNPPSGFLLRQGPKARLRVCDQACPAAVVDAVAGYSVTDETPVLYSEVHVVPQLGDYVAIPLKNRIFENQTLNIGMSDAGGITKLGLISNATALAALNSVNADLDAIAKAKEARDKAAAAAASSAQSAKKDQADQVTKENTAILECLKAQKALREAGGTPTGSCQ